MPRFPLLLSGALAILVIVVLAVGSTAKPPELPKEITADIVKQVKRSTVYLQVTDADGDVLEGSGFFAGEPGTVITNAHVVGMLDAKAKPPKKVSVTVDSGESTERKLGATVAGVDRDHDLAFLRVDGKAPEPLALGSEAELVETQKVYALGFPFGADLGKNVTVSEAAVSSLRKGVGGAVAQIQVTGDIHPGNSGGPVVNSLGHVIGVTASGVDGTRINFAIPAATVRAAMRGRLLDVRTGVAFRTKTGVWLPITCRLSDPFRAVREVRLEVWAGLPAESRGFSSAGAKSLPGDGTRQAQTLKLAKDFAAGDVVLPNVGAGQMAWLQPILVFAKGDPVWCRPVAIDPALAVDRSPVELVARIPAEAEYSVHVKASRSVTATDGRGESVATNNVDLDLLESFGPDPTGSRVQTTFGDIHLWHEENSKRTDCVPRLTRLLRRVPPAFLLDDAHKMRERVDGRLSSALEPQVRQEVFEGLNQVYLAYELGLVPFPNRSLKPLETWQATVPVPLGVGTAVEGIDLALTLTYEGSRTTATRTEAVASFVGRVTGRGRDRAAAGEPVEGRVTYDFKRGVVSSVRLRIGSGPSYLGPDARAESALDVELTRVQGNPRVIDAQVRTLAGHVGIPRLDADPFLRFQDRQFVELKKSQGVVDLNGEYTVEAWVRWDLECPDFQYIFGDEAWETMSPHVKVATQTAGCVLRVTPDPATGKHKLNAAIGSTKDGRDNWFDLVSSPRPIEPGAWQHVALCKHKDRVYIAWNGEVFGAGATGYRFNPSPTDFYLGPRLHAHMDRHLVGDIRAFRISSTARYMDTYKPPARFDRDALSSVALDFSAGEGKIVPDTTDDKRFGLIAGPTWVRPLKK